MARAGWVGAVVLSIACVNCAVQQDLRGQPLSLADSPELVWRENRDFLEKVSRGARCDVRQLNEAIAFFEIATGVPSSLIGSWGGRVLNREQIRRDLELWDEWYSTNPEQLDIERIAAELRGLFPDP